MSYYYVNSAQIGVLDDDWSSILVCVNANLVGRGSMKLENYWANGWIISADEGFDLYVKLRWNYTVAHITDEEYNRLISDRIIFFSKERTLELRKGIRQAGAYDWNQSIAKINTG